jgi:hypothetical protein
MSTLNERVVRIGELTMKVKHRCGHFLRAKCGVPQSAVGLGGTLVLRCLRAE